MAKKFLTSIDLNQNELQYAVVHALATAPATGSTGQIYFNTSDNYLYQYYNSAWHAVGVTNTYSLDAGSVSSNTVPIRLYENGTVKNTVSIKGAGGATITASNGTITITTANNNTTYTFSGDIDETNSRYRITITPSSGTAQTVDIPFATTSSSGLMSSSDKSKLDGIATGAEVNQNAFSNVKVGTTTVVADSKTDTLELTAGSNITLTPDATNDKVTIAATVPEGASPSSTTPKMDGTETVGTETAFSRGDHIHPSDTSRVPTTTTVNGKALSGNIIIRPSDIASALGVDTETLVDDAAYFEDTLNNKATGNSRIFYGTSSTASGTAAKVVVCSSYDALTTGDILVVTFSSANTASAPTLNVNSKGAKAVRSIYNGGAASTLKYAGEVRGTCIFVYDGTYWLLQHANDDTTYSAGTEALLTTGTDTANRIWQAKILHDYIASVVGGVDAMRFKGTVNSDSDLPTTDVKVGDTYMVNTEGTYAGQTCEIGDLIIATSTTPTWTVAQTNINGAITSISGTSPISVTGSESSRTVSISAASGSAAGSMSSSHYTKLEGIESGAQVNRTYTSFTGNPTANATPGFGDTVTISQIKQSTTGQVSGTNRTITIPNSTATTSAAGLMSSTDKTRLDNLYSDLSDLIIDDIYISPGSTSVTVSGLNIWSYTAYMNGEEVVVDSKLTNSGYEFSINSSQTNTVTIRYMGLNNAL